MPSLRRSSSSPAVRSSPYPSSLGAVHRGQPHGNRRSSGSETSTRRVLADIEWWKVTDGQDAADVYSNDDPDDRDPQVPASEESLASDDLGVDRPQLSLPWSMPVDYETLALSIPPQTPPRRRHVLESSSSSLESTPEASSTSFEGMRLGLEYMDIRDAEDSAPLLSAALKRAQDDGLLPISVGSISCDPFLDYNNDYADFTVSRSMLGLFD